MFKSEVIKLVQDILPFAYRNAYFIPYGTQKLSKVEVENRRNELMAKGLPKVKPIPGVKDIVLVSSGKGGVGKSTTAVNLAVALKVVDPQKNVGLLDADVFGPSIPLMMNLQHSDSPILNDKNLMEPLMNYGIKCMSMGFLVAEGAPLIWRGLMVMQALEKLMRQVHWGSIDYLIVDTPPGTGDTHLSLVQNLPVSGALLVTTPQVAAVEVTKRGAAMLEKLKVPIVGIVENMSHVRCPTCSNDVQLFGDATKAFASSMDFRILQRIPLEKELVDSSDEGVPIVISKPNGQSGIAYWNLAKEIIEFCDRNKREK